ncbi:MAG TPA: biotin/lipoyl-containing protein, partial [Pilimelia sp.]|nr:biotin/lipoyl-containing protein [Pilimelia sp.]
MPVSVTMPRLGESVTEGTVTRWLKAEGDRVEADEPLLEVSTDKVDTEIPSPAAGVLTRIVVGEDETAEVGSELAVIAGEGDAGESAPTDGAAQPAAGEPAQPDAGQQDAGQPDAGQQDAGQQDAGQQDAGQQESAAAPQPAASAQPADDPGQRPADPQAQAESAQPTAGGTVVRM